jgi:hypothetical protein
MEYEERGSKVNHPQTKKFLRNYCRKYFPGTFPFKSAGPSGFEYQKAW